jgi:hypothetical protein
VSFTFPGADDTCYRSVTVRKVGFKQTEQRRARYCWRRRCLMRTLPKIWVLPRQYRYRDTGNTKKNANNETNSLISCEGLPSPRPSMRVLPTLFRARTYLPRAPSAVACFSPTGRNGITDALRYGVAHALKSPPCYILQARGIRAPVIKLRGAGVGMVRHLAGFGPSSDYVIDPLQLATSEGQAEAVKIGITVRSFGLVEQKLGEADFFYNHVCSANWGEVRHYFSAFISAARSVTFAVQGAITGADGFDAWYGGWQKRLRDDPLARFFHECRTDSQHLGICPIVGGTYVEGRQLLFFGQHDPNRRTPVPDEDVATCCRVYLTTLCELVNDCFRVFGLLIDPNQVYTLEGLAAKGWTIEDVEEELGLPRGYTDIPWEGIDKTHQRLHLLRRSIPMSHIGNILEKYISPERVVSRPPGWQAVEP